MTQTVSRSSRVMTPSETAYRGNCTTMVASAFGTGKVDVDALKRAFEALRAEHPTLAGFMEPTAEGYDLVVPADPVPGTVRVQEAGPARPPTGREAVVDPAVELSALDLAVEPGDPERFCLSLRVYHGAYDGHAIVSVVFARLLEQYSAVVLTGEPIPAPPRAMLESCEAMIAQRGVRPTDEVSGLEEALRSAPVFPVTEAPSDEPPRQIRLTFSEDETARLRAVGKARGASVSAVVTAVIVDAIYEFLGRPSELVVPVLSVVAIRDRLDPPALATEGTVMLGTGGAIVTATATSDPLELGSQVVDRLVRELRDGVIQQSSLHLPRLLGELAAPPPEAGPASKFLVGISNVGAVFDYPNPPGLVIEDFQGISANLAAQDLGRPELGVATKHNYWFMALTYGGRLSLAFKVRDAGSAPDHELPLVRALRSAVDRILGSAED